MLFTAFKRQFEPLTLQFSGNVAAGLWPSVEHTMPLQEKKKISRFYYVLHITRNDINRHTSSDVRTDK